MPPLDQYRRRNPKGRTDKVARPLLEVEDMGLAGTIRRSLRDRTIRRPGLCYLAIFKYIPPSRRATWGHRLQGAR